LKSYPSTALCDTVVRRERPKAGARRGREIPQQWQFCIPVMWELFSKTPLQILTTNETVEKLNPNVTI